MVVESHSKKKQFHTTEKKGGWGWGGRVSRVTGESGGQWASAARTSPHMSETQHEGFTVDSGRVLGPLVRGRVLKQYRHAVERGVGAGRWRAATPHVLEIRQFLTPNVVTP